ncbi:putative RNA methyltransferase [Arthrobacter sp.]|uniref:putative RNA methyltransferase n=1 Tax=Arthrobacter sp. TaxID=1667 RepID=UPI0026DFAD8E|nr:methyltransferase domain-containing protein [Arthrobacter sp.]MDO5753879.1 methyltransferase domain-containing protein [Arthrobacter sp.]
MEFSAVKALRCPHCGQRFSAQQVMDQSLACAAGHSFDIARQGYLNLLTGPGTKFVPDTAAMVAARDAFLDAGHYQLLSDALAKHVGQLLTGADSQLIVDAGTGTGHYLHQVLSAFSPSARRPAAVGLDISKFALRRAARRNPEALNIVWDLWRELPLGTGTADVVLVIFAPRNASEFARILKPGGALIVVTPLPEHLAEIAAEVGMLGIQDDKESALVAAMEGHFLPVQTQEIETELQLSPADVENVALMGPAGHHLDPLVLRERLARLPERTAATAAFRVSVFRPLPVGQIAD